MTDTYAGLIWDYEGIQKQRERELDDQWAAVINAQLLELPGALTGFMLVTMRDLLAVACIVGDCRGYRVDGRIYCARHSRLYKRSKVPDHVIVAIVEMYSAGTHTTQQVADHFKVSTRLVQRAAAIAGVLRSASESHRLARINGHFTYRKLSPELKKIRKQIGAKRRYAIISAHPFCTLCGRRASDDTRLEVDHIDKDPTNNGPSNLQVLCDWCNIGKGG